MSNGDVKVTGANIILDADKNVEINAGGDFRVRASNSINMSSNTCYIKAPYGKIRVREVGWMGGVFKGTSVSENVWGAYWQQSFLIVLILMIRLLLVV